ncbi:MAG: hypothetical protein ACK4TA_15290 [Saprospiraceae bacterium]
MKTRILPDSSTSTNQSLEQLFKMKDYVQNLTRAQEEDSLFMLGLKGFGQILLIVLMILLSPVLIVGLTIAFIAVF